MIQRFLWVVIALVALVTTSAFFHALFPPAIPEGVAAKLKYFSEHKDEFDTLFVGTSRFYYAVSPEIFDKTTSEHGVPTRTFNFGVDGMFPPENFYVLEQILKTNPRNLKWVFLEIDEIQNKWSDTFGAQRVLYWHDWPRTLLTFKKTLDPRGDTPLRGKIERLWLARRFLVPNLRLFLEQFGNVGRAADLLSANEGTGVPPSQSELGPRNDGYRLAGNAMVPEQSKSFQQRLAREVSEAQPKFLDPTTDQAYRDCAARIRQFRANPIFVVPPILLQSEIRFQESPSPAPLFSFNDCRKYPAFYDAKGRCDHVHLSQEGAEEFTRRLALEFAGHARQP